MGTHTPGFLKLVDDAKTRIRELTCEEWLEESSRPEAGALVDVREDREFARSRIPGALHLGKGILERDIEQALPDPNTRIVLYCGGGFRSALAADALQRMGYQQVFSLAGGIRRWRTLAYPLDETLAKVS